MDPGASRDGLTSLERWNAYPREEKLRAWDQYYVTHWLDCSYGKTPDTNTYRNSTDILWP